MNIDKLKNKFFTGAWLPDSKHYYKKINEIIDYLNGTGKSGDGSYKIYRASLTQIGTDAPTATVFENNIGTITFNYEGVGSYSILSSELFKTNKTFILYDGRKNIDPDNYSFVDYASLYHSQILIYSIESGVYSDGVLNNTPIQIIVYN